MLDGIKFQVFSFLLVMVFIGIILVVVVPSSYLLDRFWPSHPRGVHGHENLVTLATVAALPLLFLALVLIV